MNVFIRLSCYYVALQNRACWNFTYVQKPMTLKLTSGAKYFAKNNVTF